VTLLGGWEAPPQQKQAAALRRARGVAAEVNVIRAKVPLVAYTDAETKLHVDVSFNQWDSVPVALEVKVGQVAREVWLLYNFIPLQGDAGQNTAAEAADSGAEVLFGHGVGRGWGWDCDVATMS
jgi:hypothetical protein